MLEGAITGSAFGVLVVVVVAITGGNLGTRGIAKGNAGWKEFG